MFPGLPVLPVGGFRYSASSAYGSFRYLSRHGSINCISPLL